MVASRNRPKGFRYGPFGLALLSFCLIPKQTGYQDFLALLSRQPAVSERARAHLLASPFGTIHAATFSFYQPVGTSMPPTPMYANFAPVDPDETGSIAPGLPPEAGQPPHLAFPTPVNRRLKGDRLIESTRPAPVREPTRDLTPGRVKTVSFPRPADWTPPAEANAEPASEAAIVPMPMFNMQTAPGPGLSDPDIKRSALEPAPVPKDNAKIGERPAPVTPAAGHSVAPKGVVTGADKRPKTPAERLGLVGKDRAKAEKCLANAVYFESRGEPRKGQIAVAQVVMNRVFSGFYPNNVCATVYQNADRRNSCQFTFACDGIPDVVNEPDMWKQAQEIARDTLDGKLWLPDIAYSTHYHAYWVHPSWVNEMRRLQKIGVHSFYRPRAWGDTVEVPNYTFVPPNLSPKAKL